MAPELDLALGAWCAAKGSAENSDLTKRAHLNGEFIIINVSGSEDQVFVPQGMDLSMVTGAYVMVTGKDALFDTSFVPGETRSELLVTEAIKTTRLKKILAKIGLGVQQNG